MIIVLLIGFLSYCVENEMKRRNTQKEKNIDPTRGDNPDVNVTLVKSKK